MNCFSGVPFVSLSVQMDVVQDKMTLAVCEQDIEFLVNVLAETLDIYYSYSTRLELILYAAEAQDAEVAHRLQSFQLEEDRRDPRKGEKGRRKSTKGAETSKKDTGGDTDDSVKRKKKKGVDSSSTHAGRKSGSDAVSSSSEAETDEGGDETASSHSAETATQTDDLTLDDDEDEEGRNSQLGDDVNRLGMKKGRG